MWKAFLEGFASRPGRASQEEGSETPPSEDEQEPEVIKEPPMEIVGQAMDADEFVRYVENLEFPLPLPNRIFLHHTWRPTRDGWRGMASILAMKDYYERQLWKDDEGQVHEGWTAGPHLFIADDGIWLFSDLRWDGVGVYGHNHRSRHVEMVGNYDSQLPCGAILRNTVVALGVLHERLGLDIDRLCFHRDYSSKSCPGWAVRKNWIIPRVAAWIEDYRRSREPIPGPLRRSLTEMLKGLVVPTNPNAALAKAGRARGLLGALSDEIPLEIDGQAYVVQFFAEALLTPLHQWRKVESLREHEQALLDEDENDDQPDDDDQPEDEDGDQIDDGDQSEDGEISDVARDSGPCMPFSPQDPFPFEGLPR